MSSGAEPAVLFTLSLEHIERGDLVSAGLGETIFSFLIGHRGGSETKTSRGETVRFLGVWCPEPQEEGGQQAREYVDRWALKHDHPKQHQFSKTLVAACATDELRDAYGRVLALVRCTQCGACLNEDLVTNGHTSVEQMHHSRALAPAEFAQHQRALVDLKTAVGPKRFGADTLLKMMSGQTPMLLA